MRRASGWVGVAVLLLGCSRQPGPEAGEGEAHPVGSSPVAKSAAGSSLAVPARAFFGLPAQALSAGPGQYALVPARSSLEEALAQGPEGRSFFYHGAWVEEVGPESSRVRWLTGQRGTVPNLLILPVRKGENAAPGSVVLTSWASGAGLQRALVVPGGTPASPRVRYLDVVFRDETDLGARPDTLPPNTFHVLTTPGEPGSSIVCRLDGRMEHAIVIKAIDHQWLGLGFGGALHLVKKDTCRALPMVPTRPRDGSVFVPVVGRFVPAKVLGVDQEIGRVRVEYEFGADPREAWIGFTNVALELAP